jgi:hypothetical protein
VTAVVRSDVPADDPARSPWCLPAKLVDGLLFRACVIRFEDHADGPYVHADSSHRNYGVGKVQVLDSGRIEIYAAGPVGAIASVHLNVDESFARDGYSVGASGGAGLTVAVFGHRSGTSVTGMNTGLYAPGRNIWCSWWGLPAA